MQQGNSLGLHVGTHQSAAGIVVLEEGDQTSGNTHNLIRSHIHVIDIFIIIDCKLIMETAAVAPDEFIVFVYRSVCLGDDIFVLRVSTHVNILVTYKGSNQNLFNAKGFDLLCHGWRDPCFSFINDFAGLGISNVLTQQVVNQIGIIALH